jgi:hypothetical protein
MGEKRNTKSIVCSFQREKVVSLISSYVWWNFNNWKNKIYKKYFCNFWATSTINLTSGGLACHEDTDNTCFLFVCVLMLPLRAGVTLGQTRNGVVAVGGWKGCYLIDKSAILEFWWVVFLFFSLDSSTPNFVGSGIGKRNYAKTEFFFKRFLLVVGRIRKIRGWVSKFFYIILVKEKQIFLFFSRKGMDANHQTDDLCYLLSFICIMIYASFVKIKCWWFLFNID